MFVAVYARYFRKPFETWLKSIVFLMQSPPAYPFLKEFGVTTNPPKGPETCRNTLGTPRKHQGNPRRGQGKAEERLREAREAPVSLRELRARPKIVQEEPM